MEDDLAGSPPADPDDEQPSESVLESPPRDGGGSPAAAGPVRPALLWVAVVLLLLFSAVQLAGVLLRDTLEGRRPVLAKAPPAPAGSEPAPAVSAQGSSGRFGPDVREIDLGGGPAAGTKPDEPESVPKPNATGGPTAGTVPPRTGTGTRSFDLGLYFSQKALRETEAKLSALGVPHFRVESQQPPRGFQLTLPVQDDAELQRARGALQKAGFLFRDSQRGPEAFFLQAEEARSAAAELAAQGAVRVRWKRVRTARPAWTLYAGPTTAGEASVLDQRLKAAGFQPMAAEATPK